ncbi:hypothetical protein EYF80_068153 [Liparis tanakae]|uniref:Uncharacterized protein n=1 Tax=Liparis tanakae TaxID=230148 RepID=A0A4Z2DYU8_9TELE|nr:hypothetical protein EYF80_068153 [Liparis tanakae]
MCLLLSPVPQNVCRRLPTRPLPGVHHRPLHGVPAPRGSETLPQHAALHLRDKVEEGGEVENGAAGETGDGQVLAGHHRGDRSAEQGGPGERHGGVLHLLPEGQCFSEARPHETSEDGLSAALWW